MKKWYAVIGDPIAQSMSPAMHEEWFSDAGIDASYIPVHVREQDLSKAIESLKRLGCSGWNVTIPHKTAIIDLLDEIDTSARMMNAVNMVKVLEDGRLYGMNTDGHGFVRSLEEKYGTVGKGKNVLLIGAGGAAKGIAFALHEAGYGPIAITNRTLEKAELLSSDIEGASAIPSRDAEANLSNFGLIVQTTSVGMNFAKEGIPLQLMNVSAGTIVADIIYNPLRTEFLEQAESKGGLPLNGVGMFVHQGALSFEQWTGVYPNTKKMIRTITDQLGGI